MDDRLVTLEQKVSPLSSAVTALPILSEATVRVKLLSPPVAAIAMGGITALALGPSPSFSPQRSSSMSKPWRVNYPRPSGCRSPA